MIIHVYSYNQKFLFKKIIIPGFSLKNKRKIVIRCDFKVMTVGDMTRVLTPVAMVMLG